MYNRQKVVLTRWREVLWKSEWMTIIWPFERPRLCLCWLGNDDPFLDTGSVPTLPEGRPQVCPDLIVFWVRAVESDVEVGSEMSVLVLDVVGGGLHKRKLAVLSQHQVPFEMIDYIMPLLLGSGCAAPWAEQNFILSSNLQSARRCTYIYIFQLLKKQGKKVREVLMRSGVTIICLFVEAAAAQQSGYLQPTRATMDCW